MLNEQKQTQPNVLVDIITPIVYAGYYTYRFIHNMARYILFMARPFMRQIAWNSRMFYAIVIQGKTVVLLDETKTDTINNYHTRYEGTDRAATN